MFLQQNYFILDIYIKVQYSKHENVLFQIYKIYLLRRQAITTQAIRMNRTVASLHQPLLPIYSSTLFWLYNIDKIRKS